MRVALCDDEEQQLAQTEAVLAEYGALRSALPLTVTSFTSGITLLEHMRNKEGFDLYLLDMIMPGENGIELGEEIRALDQVGPIVYLTSSPDFAVDSYRVKAADYLLKPVKKDRLFRTLDETAAALARKQWEFVTIKTREGLRRVPLDFVVYAELVGRCVHYRLSDGTTVEGMSLRGAFQEAVAPLLTYPQFLLCAASFLVNLDFVEMVEQGGLRLVDGGRLPLSRALRAQVTNRWMDHHLKRGVLT